MHNHSEILKITIEKAVNQLGLENRIDIISCISYLEEMLLWNKTHGLTAIVEPHEMAIKHIADSLSIYPFIQGQQLADIGTGAGLPGIPLALLFPEKTFTLIESQNKKAAFLRHIKRILKLTNVNVIQHRVETWEPLQRFDGIITRAFSSLSDMLLLTKHLCTDEGYFLAMKGGFPEEELALIAKDYPHFEVKRLVVPELDAERHVVIINQPNRSAQ